jgi:3-hydroxymyristoyl/3-hydroxydecanoyl-(acyl carrier protein) dehydratase
MEAIGAFRIAADHPALPGHFPGRPVVPGVVLLDEVLALLRATWPGRVTRLPQVKFLRPVLPEEMVAVAAAPGSGGAITFLASIGGAPVLRGTAALGEPLSET